MLAVAKLESTIKEVCFLRFSFVEAAATSVVTPLNTRFIIIKQKVIK